jgi:hypothetical protein
MTPRIVVGLFVAALTASCSSPAAPTPQPTGGGAAGPDPVSAASTARYRATFQGTWSSATHPIDFPSTAHFSPLVGGTHGTRVTFWREGMLATEGIKDMAERGLTSTLSAEIAAAIAAGAAEHVFTGGNIAVSPGLAVAEFDISQSFPLVTLVSMIAPSPDWFVGVSALALFENGAWVQERRLDLDPWDAGTDSGGTFTSPDQATAPRMPISRIVTAPLSPSGRVTPMGTFTFTRIG